MHRLKSVAPLAAAIATLIPALAAAQTSCHLNSARGEIQHVISIQFDNTHLRRDNPNVPSDLEQMPHLLNFMMNNGTLLANDHTILISHTAGGILSSLTGVYPDRHGQTVSNSYVRTSSTGGFVPELLRLLDRQRFRRGHADRAEHDRARRQQHSSALGAFYACGL